MNARYWFQQAARQGIWRRSTPVKLYLSDDLEVRDRAGAWTGCAPPQRGGNRWGHVPPGKELLRGEITKAGHGGRGGEVVHPFRRAR